MEHKVSLLLDKKMKNIDKIVITTTTNINNKIEKVKEFYYNGKLRRNYFLKDDKLHGVMIEYNDSGIAV